VLAVATHILEPLDVYTTAYALDIGPKERLALLQRHMHRLHLYPLWRHTSVDLGAYEARVQVEENAFPKGCEINGQHRKLYPLETELFVP
jgi:hypothetical protein